LFAKIKNQDLIKDNSITDAHIKQFVTDCTVNCEQFDIADILNLPIFTDLAQYNDMELKSNIVLKNAALCSKKDRLLNFLVIYSGSNDNQA